MTTRGARAGALAVDWQSRARAAAAGASPAPLQARAGRVADGVRHLAQHPCSKLGIGLGLAGRVGLAAGPGAA